MWPLSKISCSEGFLASDLQEKIVRRSKAKVIAVVNIVLILCETCMFFWGCSDSQKTEILE